MALTEMIEDRRGAGLHRTIVREQWHKYSDGTYECRALLYPEPCGGYSAVASRLPGVVSQGESEAEALANLTEAFRGAVAMYLEEPPHQIPWADVDVDQEQAKEPLQRWILVDV